MSKIISASTGVTGSAFYFTIIAIISLVFSVSVSCSAQSCNNIPNAFKSYTEAETKIKNAKFVYVDKASTPKSSWIAGASYYSCDGKSGFFLMKTRNGKSYLFQGVPIAIWQGFKTAASPGTFYNQKLRNRYKLKINKS